MSRVLRLKPAPWPGLKSAEAEIDDGCGTAYRCLAGRDLGFTIRLGEKVVIAGTKEPKGGAIAIAHEERNLATIRPSRFFVWRDTITVGGSTYRVPHVFAPGISALGITFSRLGLLGLRTHVAWIEGEREPSIGLALMGFLWARSVFVQG